MKLEEGPATGIGTAGLWSVDVASWRVNWSPEARRIHEFDSEHALSVWEALEFVDLADRPRVFAATLDCMQSGKAIDLTVGLTTAAGRSKRVRLTGFFVPASAGGGGALKGTIRELPLAGPESPGHDARTQRLLSALREWEIFGRAIPHELSGPLGIAEGFAEALREREFDNLSVRGQSHLSRVLKGLAQLRELLEGLLRFAPLATLPMQHANVSLSRLASGAIDFLRARDPDREVTVHIEPGLVAWGDPGLLRLLVFNLVGNAWKFTAGRTGATIRFGAQQTSEGTVYLVGDNGVGFDMRDAPRLFTPFERLHERHHFDGTGVGLAVVRRVAERHGGSAWAQSCPGAGATFFFTLEAGPGPAQAHPPDAGGSRADR